MRNSIIACAALALPLVVAAQPAAFNFNTIYSCPNNVTFKVTACAGSGAGDLCDVQMYLGGQPLRPGRSTRTQIMTLVPKCSANGQMAAGAGQPAATAPAAAPNRPGGKFQENDHVRILIQGQGWMDGTIVRVLTAIDPMYDVQVPGKGTAEATEQQLQFVSAGSAPGTVPAGQSPKPGLVSCAGKFEGRYASEAGGPGIVTVVFRSGKADITTPDMVGSTNGVTAMQSTHHADCWTDGGKIFFNWLDGPNMDFTTDINNDGTLDTPYGEIKKKGN